MSKVYYLFTIIGLCLALISCTPKKTAPTPVLSNPIGSKKVAKKEEIKKESPKRSGKSYVVRGKRYYLLNTAEGYDETGIGTWYGPGFHGRKTASGEVFNQNAMTAAHKTLPLGTKVRVTNLKNNKSIVVRINDRGPFSPKKIIDLSKRAGYIICISKAGIAPMRVQAISEKGSK